MSAAYSMAYTVADVLLRKEIRPEHFHDEFIRDPKIHAFTEKVRITFLPEGRPIAAEMKLRMKDGREFSTSVDVPSIDPFRKGLTKREIRDKFRRNAACRLSKEKTEKVLNLLERLEEVEDVNNIIDLIG